MGEVDNASTASGSSSVVSVIDFPAGGSGAAAAANANSGAPDCDQAAIAALKTHLALSFFEFGAPCFKLVPSVGLRVCLVVVSFCLANSLLPLYVSNQNFHVVSQAGREFLADLKGRFCVPEAQMTQVSRFNSEEGN